MRCPLSWVGLVLIAMLAFVSVAQAVITALMPLGTMLNDSQYIVVCKVDKVLPERPALVLLVAEDLKGKAPFRRLPINAKGDAGANKREEIPKLMKRFAPGLPVVLFITAPGKDEDIYHVNAYTNGTWCQLLGEQTAPEQVAWSLTHAEPFLRRTFKGPTAELRQVILDVLAGKAKPPATNDNEEAGLGPEAAPAKSSRLRTDAPLLLLSQGHGLFGVIPTLTVGGPLVILAMLFPAVFGGVLVLFRQWMAFITVLSINGTLLLLLWLWPGLLGDTWWNTPPGLWTIITLVTLLGMAWAWRRQLTSFSQLAPEAPRKTEYLILAILSLLFALVVAYTLLVMKPEAADIPSNFTLVLAVGVWGGALYKLYRHYLGSQQPLPTEGVMLGTSLLACILVAALRWSAGAATTGAVEAPAPLAATGGAVVEPPSKRWEFTAPGASGVFVSSALVHGERVYAAAALSYQRGSLYCLKRDTGEVVWTFKDRGRLRQMLSSPCLADGRLYLGEGFHDDPDCKLYCVDAKTGEKLWEFKTTGQTESSPCVADGKVYVGGGNDGLYCLDAATGSKIWLFGTESGGRLRRFGAGPAVADGRVYCGTGVDRNEKQDSGETAVFCLDAATGKQIWQSDIKLPCWGTPIVRDGHVYLGLGNGDVFDDAKGPLAPAGEVICLDAATGKDVWRRALPNGVIGTIAVDTFQVYAGCRDGSVYCLGRRDGQPRWHTDLGSPVIATPALAPYPPSHDETAHVFAIASKGKIACLDPHTGQVVWAYRLNATDAHLSSSPRVTVTRTAEGDRRQIYFGAGIGGPATGRPVVYCLEDLVKIQ